MKKNLTPILIALMFCSISWSVFSQQVLLFNENFNTGGGTFTLNATGVGTNTGNNQWVVNNNYFPSVNNIDTTQNEDTICGTGSITGAPFSGYLHISNAGLPTNLNSDYDPTAASQRFAYMTNGVCTMGMDSVALAFFYNCQGSSTAYAQIYYSLNGGPWIQDGQTQTFFNNNSDCWQYYVDYNPAFIGVSSLQIGFYWYNDSASQDTVQGMSIDDIFLVGTPRPNLTDSITNISPDTVCQNSGILFTVNLSDTLCDGTYEMQLSDATGNFNNILQSYVFPLGYPNISSYEYMPIGSNVPAGNCYKIRVVRLSPLPIFIGQPSACIVVEACPDYIYTEQPVVTMDTNAVCVGSAMDVPFYAYGSYNAGNNFIAELSDSNGFFVGNPTVIGLISSTSTQYTTINGIVPNVPAGCHYYVRVIGTNPDSVIGQPWGPFCIQHCDIETNNGHDLHFCLVPNNTVIDTSVTVQIHTYDSVQVYNPGNKFELELLSTQNLQLISTIGALGYVISTHDTSILMDIPGTSGLLAMGIAPGSYYLRVIATNAMYGDSSLGSMVHFTIGAPSDIPPAITALLYPSLDAINGPICPGDIVEFNTNPYDANSSYEWYGGFVGDSLNAPNLLINFSSSFFEFIDSVRQINFGCRGLLTSKDTINIGGLPQVNISSPIYVCLHDTAEWEVPYGQQTSYNWTTNYGNVIDTLANTIHIRFDSIGVFTLSCSAINLCGTTTGNKLIHVIAPPVAIISDSISSMEVYFKDSGTVQNFTTYHWQFGDSDSANVFNTMHTYLIPGNFEVILTSTNQGCSSMDSININLIDSCSAQFTLYPDTAIAHHYFAINNATGILPIHYDWSWGDSSPDDTIPYPSHIYADSGYYTICLSIIDSIGCQNTFCDSSYHIMRTANYMVYVNVISPAQTGIKEVNQNSTFVNIYPNPNSGTFTLSYHLSPSGIPNSELRITDVTGRTLYSLFISNLEGQENFTLPLSTGIYFWQVLNEGGIIWNGKVVVIK